jgi:hypothetical protein
MRRGAVAILIGLPVVALIYWVARNTAWVDVKVPMPPKGEALTNPFYAAQRFAERLGARTTRDRVLSVPAAESVIVLSNWHWSLSTSRRDTLQRWVESGGRLVIEGSLTGGDGDFARWSGIEHTPSKPGNRRVAEDENEDDDDECRILSGARDGKADAGRDAEKYSVCYLDDESLLMSNGNVRWALADGPDLQIIRVRVGRGSVTVINGYPFSHQALFAGDHGALFVAATELHRGDEVHFLSEADHPSLLALVWHYGAAVVILAAVFVAFALWRGAARFGPLIEPLPTARRSLAEQIRGTGQFALRHGRGESLHAACARALDEAARRRISGYRQMPAGERLSALASFTGFDRDALAAALHHAASRAHELRMTIALLEAARRQLLPKPRAPAARARREAAERERAGVGPREG